MPMKFKPFEDAWDLTQISQAHDVLFAFATVDEIEDVITQQGPFVLCRDYLSDVVFAKRTGLNLRAYGYLTDQVNLDSEYTYLLIKYDEGMAGLNNLIDPLNRLEHAGGLHSTRKVFAPELPQGIYLIRADKRWSATPQSISLFTLLLRSGAYIRGTLSGYVSINEICKSLRIYATNEGGYWDTLYDYDPDFLRKFVINHTVTMNPDLCTCTGNDRDILDSAYHGGEIVSGRYQCDGCEGTDCWCGENEDPDEIFSEIHDAIGITSMVDRIRKDRTNWADVSEFAMKVGNVFNPVITKEEKVA